MRIEIGFRCDFLKKQNIQESLPPTVSGDIVPNNRSHQRFWRHAHNENVYGEDNE